MIPRDPDILRVTSNCAIIKKPKAMIKVKRGFYLCGMSSRIWAHFLLEHLPKLYYISRIPEFEKDMITVIIPNHFDSHIRDIIKNYLSNFTKVELLELNSNEVASCEVLYHIENTSFFMDDMLYASPCDDVKIPKFVADSIKSNLVDKFYNKKQSNLSGVKLYLGRLGNVRNLVNSGEVENYFLNLGFQVIYPHLLSMQEKFEYFNNASVVVGPASSAFSNLIFSQPNTKVICFVNYFRCFDPLSGFLAQHFGLDFIMLTGFETACSGSVADERDNSYLIPLDKIQAACVDMGLL
jgi:capsular polysaccharide biosynthesis protein